jgi:hypothetical protein
MGLCPLKVMKNASVQQPLSMEPSHVPSAISMGEIEGCPRSRF